MSSHHDDDGYRHRSHNCRHSRDRNPDRHKRKHRDICAISASRDDGGDDRRPSSSSSSYSIDLAGLRNLVRDAIDIHDRNAKSFSYDNLRMRLSDLEGESSSDPTFWDGGGGGGGGAYGNNAAAAIRELNELRNKIDEIDSWRTLREDALGALDVLEEVASSSSLSPSSPSFTDDGARDDNGDAEMISLAAYECRDCATRLLEAMRRYELAALLSGPYDSTSTCRLLLTAGAGGTEACDWVSMLYRMYERHARYVGMRATTLDTSLGDVTGYKSVEMEISGPNAYGWFRAERGAHRLVRLSPFNANSKRQTTFAGVDVVPVLDDEILKDVDIPEGELEITTMRSGGKGGQNVNKVETGVRVKHIPSGIAVKCTQERSQSMNKQLALRRLKAQLLSIAQEQRVKDINAIRGDVVEASWGAQIRNYVMQPYRLVKDSRSGHETSDVDGVLDGGTALEGFVEAWLRWTRDVEESEKEQIEKYGSIL
jgi:peptide chain release factor 2